MTDEERKQFINEYCRNVGNIKIKCDDCKFVEDCVDYGWDGCKKFTQKQQHTNEEWFDELSTEEKAEFFCTVQNCLTIYGDHIATHEDWVKWLKEKHNGV